MARPSLSAYVSQVRCCFSCSFSHSSCSSHCRWSLFEEEMSKEETCLLCSSFWFSSGMVFFSSSGSTEITPSWTIGCSGSNVTLSQSWQKRQVTFLVGHSEWIWNSRPQHLHDLSLASGFRLVIGLPCFGFLLFLSASPAAGSTSTFSSLCCFFTVSLILPLVTAVAKVSFGSIWRASPHPGSQLQSCREPCTLSLNLQQLTSSLRVVTNSPTILPVSCLRWLKRALS